MNVVSDNCKCSACLNKYSCPDWKMVSAVQNIANKLFVFGRPDIEVIFQTEYCEYRKIRKKEAGK